MRFISIMIRKRLVCRLQASIVDVEATIGVADGSFLGTLPGLIPFHDLGRFEPFMKRSYCT